VTHACQGASVIEFHVWSLFNDQSCQYVTHASIIEFHVWSLFNDQSCQYVTHVSIIEFHVWSLFNDQSCQYVTHVSIMANVSSNSRCDLFVFEEVLFIESFCMLLYGIFHVWWDVSRNRLELCWLVIWWIHQCVSVTVIMVLLTLACTARFSF